MRSCSSVHLPYGLVTKNVRDLEDHEALAWTAIDRQFRELILRGGCDRFPAKWKLDWNAKLAARGE